MEDTATYLQRIWDINLNIVNCGNCGYVLIVETGADVDEHTCRFCGFTDDIGSFGDFFDPFYDTNMEELYHQEQTEKQLAKDFTTAEDFLKTRRD